MAKKMSVDLVKKTTQKLLDLVGIQGEITVSPNGENEGFAVKIETEQAGVLIGRHGETISALQFILSQIIFKLTGEWKRITVDCGDYRERHQENLENIARQVADKVKSTGEAQKIYDLSPNDRRIIHTILSEDSGVSTHSEGEGRERYLVVVPAK